VASLRKGRARLGQQLPDQLLPEVCIYVAIHADRVGVLHILVLKR